MLTLNPNYAKAADAISTAIKESGKYVGVITRAEALQSKNGNPGIGLSFKSDAGETADYLDLYMGETDGKPWAGTNTVNAIMCCMKVKQAPTGPVKFERWNKETKQREVVTAEGYPTIQGQRIGLLLQKEISEYQGNPKEKLNIFGVFNADSELTASEILSGAPKAEKLAKIVQVLMAKPVKDTRGTRNSVEHTQPASAGGGSFTDFDDDIPF